MQPVSVSKDIWWIGVNDRQTDLFEGIWPLPRGVSYNSYLIVDDKICLVDTVKQSFCAKYLACLAASLPCGRTPDYLIINHIEPDHSGAVGVLPGSNSSGTACIGANERNGLTSFAPGASVLSKFELL